MRELKNSNKISNNSRKRNLSECHEKEHNDEPMFKIQRISYDRPVFNPDIMPTIDFDLLEEENSPPIVCIALCNLMNIMYPYLCA